MSRVSLNNLEKQKRWSSRAKVEKSRSEVQFSVSTISATATTISESTQSDDSYVDVKEADSTSMVTYKSITSQLKKSTSSRNVSKSGNNATKSTKIIEVRNSLMSIFIKGSKIFGGPKTKITPIFESANTGEVSTATNQIKQTQQSKTPQNAVPKHVENFKIPNINTAKNPGEKSVSTAVEDSESSSTSLYTTDSESTPAVSRKIISYKIRKIT